MGRKKRKHHRNGGGCSHDEKEEKEGERKKKEKEAEISAVELPELALDLIVNRLVSVRDLFSFSSVCRSWRSCPLPSGLPPLLFVPILSSSPSSSFRNSRPKWTHSILKTLTPHESFSCKLPSQYLTCIGYSCGTLLFLSGPHRIVLADVFSGRITPISLPSPLQTIPRISLISRTGTILLASDSAIHCYQPPTWSHLHNHGATSLTLFDNRIFALDSDAALHSISLTRTAIRSTRVEARLPELSGPFIPCRDFRHRLVECGEDLLLIRVSLGILPPLRRRVDVFRLDLEGSVWTEVRSLGDWCLFLDGTGSCAVACPAVAKWGGRANCVFVAVPGADCDDNWEAVALDGDRLFHVPADQGFGSSSSMFLRWPMPVWVYPKRIQFK